MRRGEECPNFGHSSARDLEILCETAIAVSIRISSHALYESEKTVYDYRRRGNAD